MTLPYPSTALLKRRRTRIVATVGPSSRKPEVLEEMIRTGVDVFRLNLSHNGHDWHRETYDMIRAAAAQTGEPVAILADLCGPKIRVGTFRGGQIDLHTGERVTVTTRDVIGEPGLIPSQYAALHRDVRPGDRILLDDGLLELRVEEAVGQDVICTVINGGPLKDRKGMNLPGVSVSTPALTDKDRDDGRFAVGLGVDLLALSFVRQAGDVEDLKTLVTSLGRSTPVIAKIEKPEALAVMDEILDSAWGVMVARGDLGVELPPETVPIAQQELVEHARRKNKPVIVATQMLESMVHNPRPTRAEVSDVSHAVFAGADAVMLSAETSVGEYPVGVVGIMDRIARQVEGWQWAEGAFRTLTRGDPEAAAPMPLRMALARATAQLSRDLRVRAIVVRTRSGTSATVVAATRPAAPVVALTADEIVCRRLNLLWGVIPRLLTAEDFEQPAAAARRQARTLGLASPGEYILLLAGFGRGEPMITVLPV
jgi:pyruvate kinase